MHFCVIQSPTICRGFGFSFLTLPLSKFDLRRLCQAVGATPLVRLGRPLAEELGTCSSVRTEEIGSTTGKEGSVGCFSLLTLRHSDGV